MALALCLLLAHLFGVFSAIVNEVLFELVLGRPAFIFVGRLIFVTTCEFIVGVAFLVLGLRVG